LSESLDVGSVECGGSAFKHANAIDFLRRLRARGMWGGEEASCSTADENSPIHH
jgi:hypothetical protein